MKPAPLEFRLIQNMFVVLILGVMTALRADEAPQSLPLVQDWSNAGLITSDNDWSRVPGFMGYRGDRLVSKPGMSPETVTADGAGTPVDVIANQKNPNSLRTGGVAEFDGIPDVTIALKGSATAGAPSLVLNLNTAGKRNVAVGYNLRDLDGSANNAVQAVAFQYRTQTNVAFTDISAAFVADASTGPGLATEVIHRVVLLPEGANNQPLVQVRWITCNADGNDEWIGVDDIAVIGDEIARPAAVENATTKSNAPVKALRSPKDSVAN